MSIITTLYYNFLVSTGSPAGTEWISSELEEFDGYDWNGNTIQQITQRELTEAELPQWADELAECYFGPDGFDASDREDFVRWVGAGGEEVAKKIDWREESDDDEESP